MKLGSLGKNLNSASVNTKIRRSPGKNLLDFSVLLPLWDMCNAGG
jgi:hypothetical protein